MITLKKLLENIPNCQVKGSDDILITGISSNSKMIAPGNVFIAKAGKTYQGSLYIPEAIQSGACVVVTDCFDPSLTNSVQVIHPHVASIESDLAASYYQHPSQELLMVGITGTNGKTTTSYIVKDLLERLFGSYCGLIGTIEYVLGEQRYPATRTTPDVTTNHKMLREMLKQGCHSAVMEVSSHALDQGRVDHIDFDVAIFSNLTLEHLDYHGSMENYGKAKKRLFQQLGKNRSQKQKAKWAIVNQDSPWTPYLIEDCSASILSYGIEAPADLQATHIRLGQHGTRACVIYQGKSVECEWPLVGRFNIYNCLAAMAVALSQEIPLERVVSYLSKIPFIRGRLQPIKNALDLKIYVDFAHSDDALLNALVTLKEVQKTSGCLIVVFGCGGDRDRTKRSKMAQVCEKYADFCVVTSDNPRSEDPHKICEEVIMGFKNPEIYHVEVDRREAIQQAILRANPEDIILIAGKGHETYQIFAHHTLPFDDCQVATEICAQLASTRLKSV